MSQDFNSGELTRSGLPVNGTLTGMGGAKAREVAAERVTQRKIDVAAKLPPQFARIILGAPAKYIGRALKGALGELSPKGAIKAQCEQCVGYEDVRDRVGKCSSRACMLWFFRPHQAK